MQTLLILLSISDWIGLLVFGPFFLLVAGIAFWLIFKGSKKKKNIEVEANTIQKSISNIAKLMVTEGEFSEVYSYKEKDNIFFNLIPVQKKALIILNAKVQIGYNLQNLKFHIDKDKKEVTIQNIPEEEVTIIPDLKFYDVQSSNFSSFSSEDINKVQKDAKKKIAEKVEESDLKLQSRKRLIESIMTISEMSTALGWKVKDKTKVIEK